jgi:hypothetical protein
MFKAHLLVLGATLAFASAVQAEAPQKQSDARVAVVAKKAAAAAPEVDTQTRGASTQQNNATNEELHPDARPVYLNGGHFGDN